MGGGNRNVERPRGGRPSRLGMVSLLAGVVLLLLLVWLSGLSLSALGAAVARISPAQFAGLALLQSLVIVLGSAKWVLILNRMGGGGSPLPLGAAIAGTTYGTLLGQVMPIHLVTPVARAWVARPFGIPVARAVGTSIFEALFEAVALVSMAVASLLILSAEVTGPVAGAAALGMLAAIVLFLRPILMAIERAMAAFPNTGAGGANSRLRGALAAAAEFSRRDLAVLTALSLARYAMLATISVGVIAQILALDGTGALVLAFPVILLATSAPVAPAGLGIVEVTWSGVLVAMGVAVADAAAAVIALRLISLATFLAIVPIHLALRALHRHGTPRK